MRRLLAPLTRWLDRRIDARIAAASNEVAQRTLNHLKSSRVSRSTFGGLVNDAAGSIPTGQIALAEMAAAGIRDAAAVQREGR